MRPVGAVGDHAEVGERPLGRADLALLARELVREGDEEAAVALALVGRQREDARQVVLLGRALLLGEVGDGMAALQRRRETEMEGFANESW